eukprot:6562478-Prymnesium_polylepis.2
MSSPPYDRLRSLLSCLDSYGARVMDILEYIAYRVFHCEPERQPCSGACCAEFMVRFRAAVKALKQSLLTMYYASLDDEAGCLPRILIAVAVAYALSPIDLIPDFIPVLGLVDDLLLLPLLIYLARLATPPHVLERARLRADNEPLVLPRSIAGAVFVGVVWYARVRPTCAAALDFDWHRAPCAQVDDSLGAGPLDCARMRHAVG